MPGAKVAGSVGRSSSFEVVIDGQYLAHSKLTAGGFPDYAKLGADVAAYVASKAAPASWKKLA